MVAQDVKILFDKVLFIAFKLSKMNEELLDIDVEVGSDDDDEDDDDSDDVLVLLIITDNNGFEIRIIN